ncbi:MAG: M56 family metallopeptidase [Ekhidna sp.]
MNELITFSVKFVILSTVFYVGYLIIQNHTTPAFKRFYLLAWMFFSISFPLIQIQSSQYSNVNIRQRVMEASNRPQPDFELKEYHELALSERPTDRQVGVAEFTSKASNSISASSIVQVGYLVVAVFLLLRVGFGFFQILRLKSNSKQINELGVTLYEVDDPAFKGASFFGWIFIGKAIKEDRDVVIRHEQIHYLLGHSFDILLSHIYCALFWISPFSWILKKSVSINSEMEADARILHSESKTRYTNILLSLSQSLSGSRMMNHFSAFHLKSRIIALTKTARHRKWVSAFTFLTVYGLFFTISCENVNSPEIMEERMGEVKTITTRFTSHQSDTQQKTGKVVSMATFLPDGTLGEFVTQTTYPYDHEFEKKKEFWDEPIRQNLFYIMDGLGLGAAEKSLLYGNDWPKSYAKYLKKVENGELIRRQPFEQKITVDNMDKPTEIKHEKINGDEMFFFGMADVTEFFVYDGNKVIEVAQMNTYPEIDDNSEHYQKTINYDGKEISIGEYVKERKIDEGVRKISSTYEYIGELLKSIEYGDYYGNYKYMFFYENKVLVRSEYYKNDNLISSRFHYYEKGLKDRTEIFNRYNEPEYTITYEYEFW